MSLRSNQKLGSTVIMTRECQPSIQQCNGKKLKRTPAVRPTGIIQCTQRLI